MAENAMFMMHNPSGLVLGDANDMRKVADSLDKIRDSMVTVYTAKSKKSDSEIISMMDGESWLDADEAKEAGFADVVSGKKDMTACAKFLPVMAKMGFKHIPNDLTAKRILPSEKDLERALRDVGCSIKQAKTILAKGYDDDLRDVDAPPQPLNVTESLRDVEPPKPVRKESEERRIRDRHLRPNYLPKLKEEKG
jgi:hypothetical protein